MANYHLVLREDPPGELEPSFTMSQAVHISLGSLTAALQGEIKDQLEAAFGEPYDGMFSPNMMRHELGIRDTVGILTIIVTPGGDDDQDPEPFNNRAGGSAHKDLAIGPVVAFRRFMSGAQVIYQPSPARFGQFCLAPAWFLTRKLADVEADPTLLDVAAKGPRRNLSGADAHTLLQFKRQWVGIVGIAYGHNAEVEDLRPPTKDKKGKRLPQLLVKVKWTGGASSWETYSDIAKIQGLSARREIYDTAVFFWAAFVKWAKDFPHEPAQWEQSTQQVGYRRSVTPEPPRWRGRSRSVEPEALADVEMINADEQFTISTNTPWKDLTPWDKFNIVTKTRGKRHPDRMGKSFRVRKQTGKEVIIAMESDAERSEMLDMYTSQTLFRP